MAYFRPGEVPYLTSSQLPKDWDFGRSPTLEERLDATAIGSLLLDAVETYQKLGRTRHKKPLGVTEDNEYDNFDDLEMASRLRTYATDQIAVRERVLAVRGSRADQWTILAESDEISHTSANTNTPFDQDDPTHLFPNIVYVGTKRRQS